MAALPFATLAPVLVGGSVAQAAPVAIPKGGPSVQVAGLTPALANQKYASASSTQTLDIYTPTSGAGPFPFVVYAHPGGFRFGSKDMATAAYVEAFLKAGYAVVPVNYRLSGEATFPTAVQDVFEAIAYLKANAAKYALDPDAFVMFGESAGANLASLVGTAYDAPLFRKTLADGSVDLRPEKVIALYPPVDMGQIDAMLKQQGCPASAINHGQAGSFESRYLGAAVAHSPDLVAQANPVTYASAGDPPFFIESGSADCNVGAGQGKLLAQALEKAGVSATYHLLDGAGHGGLPFEAEDNVARMLGFLKGN
ncbi:alpha/beta hydrolase fold domain-containing protein [Stutzerimonas chloritidismutans]|uniref:alpha/beta hydrolase fold domain-containing protein n=1 Tax=Stutzerimonas chloritidismutans TaxID=203192 RepID=UPI003F176F53